MRVLKGCETNPDEFLSLLTNSREVSLVIDLHRNLIQIVLHDNCGGTSLLFTNEDLKSAACVGTLNNLIRTAYAAKQVCLTVFPFIGKDDSSLSSLSQGLAEVAKQMVCDFSNAELYPKLQAIIANSLITYEP